MRSAFLLGVRCVVEISIRKDKCDLEERDGETLALFDLNHRTRLLAISAWLFRGGSDLFLSG